MRKMIMMLILALGVSINGFAQSARRGDVTKHMQQAIVRVADAPPAPRTVWWRRPPTSMW